MKFLPNIAAAAVALALLAPAAQAGWQDQLATATSQLSETSAKPGNGSLTSLLAGGTQSLAANSMPNVAGVFEYCVKQKLVKATDPQNIKNKLMDKLGLSTPQEQTEKPGYLDGLSGLLNTRDGQQLNLNTLSNSALGQKVKNKACNIVLDQSLSYIGN